MPTSFARSDGDLRSLCARRRCGGSSAGYDGSLACVFVPSLVTWLSRRLSHDESRGFASLRSGVRSPYAPPPKSAGQPMNLVGLLCFSRRACGTCCGTSARIGTSLRATRSCGRVPRCARTVRLERCRWLLLGRLPCGRSRVSRGRTGRA